MLTRDQEINIMILENKKKLWILIKFQRLFVLHSK